MVSRYVESSVLGLWLGIAAALYSPGSGLPRCQLTRFSETSTRERWHGGEHAHFIFIGVFPKLVTWRQQDMLPLFLVPIIQTGCMSAPFFICSWFQSIERTGTFSCLNTAMRPCLPCAAVSNGPGSRLTLSRFGTGAAGTGVVRIVQVDI